MCQTLFWALACMRQCIGETNPYKNLHFHGEDRQYPNQKTRTVSGSSTRHRIKTDRTASVRWAISDGMVQEDLEDMRFEQRGDEKIADEGCRQRKEEVQVS